MLSSFDGCYFSCSSSTTVTRIDASPTPRRRSPSSVWSCSSAPFIRFPGFSSPVGRSSTTRHGPPRQRTCPSISSFPCPCSSDCTWSAGPCCGTVDFFRTPRLGSSGPQSYHLQHAVHHQGLDDHLSWDGPSGPHAVALDPGKLDAQNLWKLNISKLKKKRCYHAMWSLNLCQLHYIINIQHPHLTLIEPSGGGGKFASRPTFCCVTPEP